MPRKDQGERRKNKRYTAKEGAFVATRVRDTYLWHILDIGRGGLSFRYVAGLKGELDLSSGLDLATRDADFSLENISIKNVYDCEFVEEHPKQPKHSTPLRRRGVEFEKLTSKQMSEIEYFIQNYTIT